MKTSLFTGYDELETALSPLSETTWEAEGRTMTIRLVWIIVDLALIYDWLNAPLFKSNWQFNHKRVTVMQHYKRMLNSDETQSFMMEQNHIPVMQIDLLPARLADLPKTMDYAASDYSINYLFRESFRDPYLFKNCLEAFIRFVFLYPDIRYLFLRLPGNESSLGFQMEGLGFVPVQGKNFFGNTQNIYKITRAPGFE